MTDNTTDACTLPRQVIARDVPHPQIGEMQRDQFAWLDIDLSGCNLHIVYHAFNEFEEAEFAAGRIGLRYETWPPGVRSRCDAYVADFTARTGSLILALTTAITPNNLGSGHGAALGLHWRPKKVAS